MKKPSMHPNEHNMLAHTMGVEHVMTMRAMCVRLLCILFCLCLFSFANSSGTLAQESAAVWQQNLSLPGNDTWRARIPITVRNDSEHDTAGWMLGIQVGNGPDQVNLAGADVQQVRVCDAAGTEMLFDLRDLSGRRLTKGVIPVGATLTVPVTVPKFGIQQLYVYFDNPDAYQVPDYLTGLTYPTQSENLQVQIGDTERLNLQSDPADTKFVTLSGFTWETRLPVMVVNTGNRMNQVLVQVPMTKLQYLFQRGFRPQSVRVVDPEKQQAIPYLVAGDNLLFLADVPERSMQRFYIYISRNPEIPTGTMLSYAQLVAAPGNLARNPSFEQGGKLPDAWLAAGPEVGAHERLSGGIVGEYFARTAVPQSGPSGWPGWQQEVQTEPGSSYLFLAYVRTIGHTGGVTLYAHILEKTALGITRRYWNGAPVLTGTSDWQLVGGVISTLPRESAVQLHLTTNGRGIVDHDGVIMMQTASARIGELETNAAVTSDAFTVWSENPLVKVFPDTPPSEAARVAEPVNLYAARGEQEVWQLAVRPNQAIDLEIAITRPSNGDSQLPAPKVERVGFVPVLQPSGYHNSYAQEWERRVVAGGERTDGWQGWWPDYLMPIGDTLQLPAQRTQPLWITFTVPKDAAPGIYTGTIHITGGGQTQAIPFTIRVWHFALPDKPSLQVIYDLRRGPNWTTAESTTDRENWWRFMSEKRISADAVLPDPRFSLVNGQVVMDTTEFDRAAQHYFDELHMAVAYFPGIFYAAGWGLEPRAFLGQPFGTQGYEQAYQQAVRLFWEHLKQKGWANRMVLYLSDEPSSANFTRLLEIIRLIRSVDPQIPIYSSTWDFVPVWEGELNHWGAAQDERFPQDIMQKRLAAGDKIWFTTDGMIEINTPYTAYERLLPYYCFARGIDGYEYWGVSWYTYNPFEFGWHSFIQQSMVPGEMEWVRYPNGDGYMAYPGEMVGIPGPLSSIRLEQVREGLEDYEIYTALRHLAEVNPNWHDEIGRVLADVEKLAALTHLVGYRSMDVLPDPDTLIEVRQRAGALLEELLLREPSAATAGQVVDTLGRGVGNIDLSFSGGATGVIASAADGNWRMGDVRGYTTIVPSKAGWTFVPAQATASAGASGLRFVGTPPAPKVSFDLLRNGTTASGMLHPKVVVEWPESLPQIDLKSLTLTFDDEPLYTGTEIPDQIYLDTLMYPDGQHTLAVVVETDYGATAGASVKLDVDNWWEIDDQLEPPVEMGFFGTIDYTMTSSTSPGWEYATDNPESFGGDTDRKVRTDNTEEFLIWETPELRSFAITMYSTVSDLSGAYDLAVSADGQNWQAVSYTTAAQKVVGADMFAHQLSGSISGESRVRYMRLTLLPTGVSARDVQIGRAWFTGLTEELSPDR